ncbi:hypothetical protein WJX73_002787 [Symbiochloris irregularis]|uniref:Uncharacterized protein n=1 Tax=Symbiochloris irregularis TaxID=706552 RepID=A0AAW1P4G6_9CHLO
MSLISPRRPHCQNTLFEGNFAAALQYAQQAEAQLLYTGQTSSSGPLLLALYTSLATALTANHNYDEAVQTYQTLLRLQPQAAAQYRSNMASIHAHQDNFSKAVREYRMALDQLPPNARPLRSRIYCNLGVALQHQGLTQDALTAFESALDQALEPRAAFNLAVCTAAADDHENARPCFSRLIQACVRGPSTVADPHNRKISDPGFSVLDRTGASASGVQNNQYTSEQYVVVASRLLAPFVDPQGNAAKGLDWPSRMASKVPMRRAFPFPWPYCGRTQACEAALRMDPSCVQALHNLGLAKKQQGLHAEAQAVFERISQADPSNAEAAFQVAACWEEQGKLLEAANQLEALCLMVPRDAGVLSCLASLHARLGSQADALRCFQEAHDIDHGNREALEWLAAHHLKFASYGQAEGCYRHLERLDSGQPQWAVMVAACLHAQGLNQEALEQYRKVHEANPDNQDCLRQLAGLCREQGLSEEADGYLEKLNGAEKASKQENPLQSLVSCSSFAERPAVAKAASFSHARPASSAAGLLSKASLPGTRALLKKDSGLTAPRPLTAQRKKKAPSKDIWGPADDALDLLPQEQAFQASGATISTAPDAAHPGRPAILVAGEATMTVADRRTLSMAFVPVVQPPRCFPYCLVWCPIPVLSWLLPFVGHMGICTSTGKILDFAASFYVSADAMAFGNPTRYWQLDPARASALVNPNMPVDVHRPEQAWDDLLQGAVLVFQQRPVKEGSEVAQLPQSSGLRQAYSV